MRESEGGSTGEVFEASRAGGQGHEATLLLALSRPPSCLLCPALPLPPAFAQVASRSSAKRSLRRRSLRRRSHYYGVSRPEGSNRWQATKRYNGKVWMASFDTEEQAARQYDTWARQCYGQRAIVNFPAEVEQHPPRWQSQSRVPLGGRADVWRCVAGRRVPAREMGPPLAGTAAVPVSGLVRQHFRSPWPQRRGGSDRRLRSVFE